jgi:hypothetical protein
MVGYYHTNITAAAVSIPSLGDQDHHNDQDESFSKKVNYVPYMTKALNCLRLSKPDLPSDLKYPDDAWDHYLDISPATCRLR